MAWYEQTAFYHIYPLGLTGAPERNEYREPEHRFELLFPWIRHIRELGCTGLYIGPLFESGSHGYDTTDYRKVDSRLGTNEDLSRFVKECHAAGIRVILDGVFNHTGRDFFAFRDILEHRESSRYVSWYCNVNFQGNNEYNDGFSYDNWGGHNLLAKLNLRNPEVRDYLMDTIRFWVSEFGIDGLRLDAADVLDFDFMRCLRGLADEIGNDFWLMGEVIHGEYSRWVNERTLHSVTNYHLHKALFSGHNDHNYFEIAHTVKRQMDMGLGNGVHLYSFADNHDVERIYTKLREKAHFLPVHVLLYTLPGLPSIYYGSEFGVEGRKERWSDASLRPCLELKEEERNSGHGDGNGYILYRINGAGLSEEERQRAENCRNILRGLGRIYSRETDLWYGDYRELQLTTGKFAFARGSLIVTVNNESSPAAFDLSQEGTFIGALSGKKAVSENGNLHLEIGENAGEIWIPEGQEKSAYKPVIPEMQSERPIRKASKKAAPGQAKTKDSRQMTVKAPEHPEKKESVQEKMPKRAEVPKLYEEMTVEELQAEILAKMAANGPVTDRMKQDVLENVYPDSLLNWVKSFRN